MNYRVKLPIFEGPLDLLLHLIEENKIDIYNIPIAIITQQYLDYLDKAREIDLDLTSEFIVMACYIIGLFRTTKCTFYLNQWLNLKQRKRGLILGRN